MDDGKKYDEGKLRYDLVPWAALDEVVRVLGHGAQKYGDDNWRRVKRLEDRYPAAALRHMSRYLQGETNDPETGLNHLAHAVCSLMFVLALDKEAEEELSNDPQLRQMMEDARKMMRDFDEDGLSSRKDAYE